MQLRRAIGAVRRAQQNESDAAWAVFFGRDAAARDVANANHEWARAAMHLLAWGLS